VCLVGGPAGDRPRSRGTAHQYSFRRVRIPLPDDHAATILAVLVWAAPMASIFRSQVRRRFLMVVVVKQGEWREIPDVPEVKKSDITVGLGRSASQRFADRPVAGRRE